MLSLPRLQILIHSSLYFTLGLTKAPDGNEATVLLATVPAGSCEGHYCQSCPGPDGAVDKMSLQNE